MVAGCITEILNLVPKTFSQATMINVIAAEKDQTITSLSISGKSFMQPFLCEGCSLINKYFKAGYDPRLYFILIRLEGDVYSWSSSFKLIVLFHIS